MALKDAIILKKLATCINETYVLNLIIQYQRKAMLNKMVLVSYNCGRYFTGENYKIIHKNLIINEITKYIKTTLINQVCNYYYDNTPINIIFNELFNSRFYKTSINDLSERKINIDSIFQIINTFIDTHIYNAKTDEIYYNFDEQHKKNIKKMIESFKYVSSTFNLINNDYRFIKIHKI